MRFTHIIAIAYSVDLSTGVRTAALRAKRDFNQIVPGGGLSIPSFDPSGITTTVDVGNDAQAAVTQYQRATANAPVLTLSPVTDNGMTQTIFGPPSTSYSAPLAAFTPTEYAVTPCAPSANDEGCLKGTQAYNLGLTIQTLSR